MRRLLFFGVFLVALFGGCLAVSGAAMAYAQPFAPGHPLHKVQRNITAWVMPRLPAEMQAQFALRMLERHIDWMNAARGTPQEVLALQSLDESIVRSAQALSQVPPELRPAYQRAWARRLAVVQQAMQAFSYVPEAYPQQWRQIQDKVNLALQLAGQSRLQQEPLLSLARSGRVRFPEGGRASALPAAPAPSPGSGTPTVTPLPQPQPIPFPTDFASRHTFFPLTGRHGQIACESCHTGGQFAGTPDSCQACHAQDRPANHFQGECSLCHNTTGWRPAHFNHQAAGATDCIACHLKDRPANHFQGQCSQCHSTTAWRPAHFNHTFPIDHGGANGVCSTCHPNGTASYTCTACHSMAEMQAKHQKEGIFDIAGRCAVCHAGGGDENGGGDHEGGGGGDENGGGEHEDD